MASFVSNGAGTHMVTLDSAIAPGHWLRLELEIAGVGTASTVVNVWLAHLPLDINQDGTSNVRDATAFGSEFHGRRDKRLLDIDGDGVVNVRDATAFSHHWNGVPPAMRAWQDTELPAKPE